MTDLQPTSKPVYKTACGGTISDPENYPSALYQGERIYFCLPGCLEAFETDPQRFMAGEIDHPDA
jgi:YHS domain-containing protein